MSKVISKKILFGGPAFVPPIIRMRLCLVRNAQDFILKYGIGWCVGFVGIDTHTFLGLES